MCVCNCKTCLENLFSCRLCPILNNFSESRSSEWDPKRTTYVRLSSTVVSNLCSSIYQSISYEFLISGCSPTLPPPLSLSPSLPLSLSDCTCTRRSTVLAHQFDFLHSFSSCLKRTNRSTQLGLRILNKISFCARPFKEKH